MTRWLLALVFVSGCASPEPLPIIAAKPIDTPSVIWLPIDIPPDVQLCGELFENDGMYRWRCTSVGAFRTMINGLRTAN